MRLVNIQNLTLDYSGLAKIEPHNYLEICRYFANQIMELPTISPDDLVKHGEWRWKTEIEPDEHYICFCSCCKKTCHIWYDKEDDMEYYIRSNYCPNCGAKMDGGKENE